jgi:hypothetical protein
MREVMSAMCEICQGDDNWGAEACVAEMEVRQSR